MLRFALVLATLCFSVTAHAQDPLKLFEARTFKEGDKILPYRLLVPKGYQAGTPWPLIVWLHGSNEVGNDNAAQIKGLAGTILSDPNKCPAFVMVPQCPQGESWVALGLNKAPPVPEPCRLVVAAIAGLTKEFSVDDRRLYLGGFSMGGCGTWEILTRYPGTFAAAFPIAGPPGDRKNVAPLIKHVPLWVFQGANDPPLETTRALVADLKAAGADLTYLEPPGVAHEFRTALADPKLPAWLFAQKRSTAPDFTQKAVPEEATQILRTLAEGTTGTWTGAVERTGHKVPRLPIDGVRYRLKPSANAGPDVADLLARIGKGEVKGVHIVTGTIELRQLPWMAVERIVVKK